MKLNEAFAPQGREKLKQFWIHVDKVLLGILLILLLMISTLTAVAQSMTYKQSFDLSAGGIHQGSFDVGDENTIAHDLAFSADGLTMFVVDTQNDNEINQYSLTNPFDITSDVAVDGSPLDVSGVEEDIMGLAFSNDGLRLFIVGHATDAVHQYTLSSAFDINSTVTYIGSHDVSSEDIYPYGIEFNDDGTKMYVLGSYSNDINQYSLSNPFDITSGVTFDGNSISFYPLVNNDRTFIFGQDGSKVYVVGMTYDQVTQYSLATPYDVTSGMTYDGIQFYLGGQISAPTGLAFSPDGTKLFAVGYVGDVVHQYELNTSSLLESDLNNGSFSGQAAVQLEGETFTNSGGMLIHNSDYTIGNLPVGLTPELTVSTNGSYAILTFNGRATSHQNENDLASLQFTFENSAFSGNDASSVANSSAASSGINLDFEDNNPEIVYDFTFDIEVEGTFDGELYVGGDENNPTCMTFNSDGTKLYVVGYTGDAVYQYALSKPFDLNGSAILEGTPYSIAGEDTQPEAITFNDDGSKMYILGAFGPKIVQYSLSTPFDINSTVTHDGNSMVLSGQETQPRDFTFSADGYSLFLIGVSGDDVNQYSMTTAFDVTDGFDVDGDPFSISTQEQNPTGLDFSADGRKMFITGLNTDAVLEYHLEVPFDISAGVSYSDKSLDLTGVSNSAYEITFHPEGTSFFVLGNSEDRIFQYEFEYGQFEETDENLGGLDGEFKFKIIDDMFVNAGSALVHRSHYAINNLPIGLEPNLAISASGQEATLTFTGYADDHQNEDDIASINISFANSAFDESNAADVINAIAAETNYPIDFNENNEKLKYGDGFVLSLYEQNSGIYGAPVNNVSDVLFNNDGTKMFVSAYQGGGVYTHDLSVPYDIFGTTTLIHTFDPSSEESQVQGIDFSADGYTFFLIGSDGDDVNQYSLTTAFDLSTATHEGAYSVASNTEYPYGIAFSNDGLKMFILGIHPVDVVFEYNLSSPYDITSTVSYEGESFNVGLQSTSAQGIGFSSDGEKFYMNSTTEIFSYSLASPFDIATMSYDGISKTLNSSHTGFEFSANGEYLYATRATGLSLMRFELERGGFNEQLSNAGTVEGALNIHITDDYFTNTGGSFTYGNQYSIANLPIGLIPDMSISADGTTATLTLTGSVDDHQDEHDVSSLNFTFTNAAFLGDDASAVENAVAASSEISIDFADNNSTVSYGYGFSIENGLVHEGESAIEEDTNPQGIKFNADGTKMYIIGNSTDQIYQYTLSAPYQIHFGRSLDGALDFSSYDITPLGINFSPTGDKLYIAGLQNHKIYQFDLGTLYDITSNISYEGTQSITLSYPRAITFDDDGTNVYLNSGVGSGQRIVQYSLAEAYDITSSWTLLSSYDPRTYEANPSEVLFADNGFTMLVVGLSRNIHSFRLTVPYDLGSDINYDEAFLFSSLIVSPSGFAFDDKGSRVFISEASSSRDITEFSIQRGGFIETVANDGNIEGDLTIRVFDAAFTNPGGNLTESTDYTVSGIPSGLTPTFAVAPDGLSATLTFSGIALEHQNSNDVDDLVFTFNNSAFTNGNVSLIKNVSSASSNLGIDFLDNYPTVVYGDAFDVRHANYSGVSYNAGQDAMDIAFSPDGTKMFTVDFYKNVEQFDLANPFDILTGVTVVTPSFLLTSDGMTSDEVPVALNFSTDGLKMFVVSNYRLVHQYSLTTPFDVTSGVTHDGNPLDVFAQETSPGAIRFKPDGTKMYIVGNGSDVVNQYSLANPFDITSGVTYDGNPLSIVDEEDYAQGLAFSADGRKMLIAGSNGDQVYQYALSAPYDITSIVTYVGSPFSVSSEDNNPTGIAFSATGERFFITGRTSDLIYQYDIEVGSFKETALNDGDVEGTVTIYMNDDKFANAGSTLTHASHYTINNLPSGLTPSLSVAADGFSASLSISGQVDDHQETNSVEGLQFTFANSAFVSNAAADVANAIAANSNLNITLRDNVPEITYGNFYNFENASVDGALDVNSEDEVPANIAFSADGLTLFVTGRVNEAIFQYGLTTPFDVSSGVSYEGLLDISAETLEAMDLQFSPDGMTLLVLSDNVSSNFGSLIVQYDLTSAFDITSSVTYSGSSFDLSSQITNPSGFAFNRDGTKVFITNGFHSNETIYYYTLNSAFDISGGLTYDGNLQYKVESESLYDLSFNEDGTSLFVLIGPLSDRIVELKLESPYDLTSTFTLGQSFSVSSQADFPQGFIFGPNGNKLYVIGSTSDDVSQYTLTDEGFVENNANDGSIDGSLEIKIVDDFFANSGGNLSTPSDYSISNLPAGLNPVLSIDGSGQIATLTFNGNSSSHLDQEDVESLEFTFENSAFVNFDATGVINAIAASSGVEIDFIANTDSDILTFALAEETNVATINSEDHTVDIEVVFGTDVTALIPFFTISDGAVASMESNTEADFSNPVTIVIIAEDQSVVQNWEVTVTIAPNTENDILEFTFGEISGSAIIDDGAHTVTAKAEPGTDISSLTPAITISENALIDPDNGEVQDFTDAVTYMVTAENSDVQNWEVTISEELAAPTDISLTSSSIDENGSVNDVVGVLSSEDASFSDTHTYALVEGTGDDNNSSFDIVGNELQALEIFDHETKSSYIIRVQTDDGNGETFEKQLIILINDLNETPTDLDLTDNTIDESSPVGTNVGTLTTTDEDQGQSYTYTLVSGAGDTDNASFDIEDNKLVSNEVFDYETRETYAVRIQTDDGNGGTYAESFIILINDLPASVTAITMDSYSVSENEVSGTVVGNLQTSGEDLSGSFTYDLVAGSGSTDNVSFTISGSQLLTAESFNHEVKNSYLIRVSTDDGNGHTLEQPLTITIDDVSEVTDANIVSFELSEQTGVATINNINKTVAIEVAYGTDVTNLNPSITVSAGASISPLGTQDFSEAVTYTVTAEEPTVTEVWTVFVTEAASNETDILTFELTSQTGVATIDATNHTILVEVVFGTDLSNLTPVITVSAGAALSPEGPQDFTSVFAYTVTAEDGVTAQNWEVTVVEEEGEEILAISSLEKSLKVFPNPAAHQLFIDGFEGPVKVEFIDLRGQIVLIKNIQQPRYINVNNIQSGIYHVRITNEDFTTTTKILIRK